MALPARTRVAIALRAAELSGCGTCAALHTALGASAGIDAAAADAYRRGLSDDVREQALLAFTTKLVLDRGRNCRLALDLVRRAGAGDREVVEVAALVGLHTFANALDLLARARENE